MLNIKYAPNINLEILDEPHLIISSHYYNTVDAMIMCEESHKTKKTINIIAEFNLNTSRDLYNQFWKSLPIYTPYRKVNLYKGYKNNLVDKSKNYLNKKEHVLMFLNKKNKSKGVYHILKDTKVPILFVKIYRKDQDLKIERRDNNFISSFYGKEFKVEYNIVKKYDIDNMKEDEFMDWVKNNLYDN